MYGFVAIEEVDSADPSSVGISASITGILIECWCLSQLQWVTYETDNVSSLWERVVRHVRGYLLALWASGMLKGNTSQEAFVIRCDQTTMTQGNIREGNLVILLGVAPLKPSEFVHYRIRIRLKSVSNPLARVSQAW